MNEIKTILWIDDIRKPNPQERFHIYGNVAWVKNYHNAIQYIKWFGMPDYICFDHDLGEEKTGYDIAKWIVEYCMDNNIEFPEYRIQSDNIVGKQNIKSLIDNFKNFHYGKN